MDRGGSDRRYRAFVSYSHKDAAFGRRLHRRLEAFRLPGRLVGKETPRGPVPKRVSPIFRDLDELPAAGDLSAEVQAALAASGALVVVCSPSAAESPWVAREIELFRAQHPDRPILAALIEGEPAEAFPEALVRPSADGRPVEPLAADFRKDGDGARLALLKLVAGVVGVRLDELIQRDAQRRLRTVTAITVAALTLTLAMGLLTVLAVQARRDADRQRAEAEGLVEFMLTDLRDRLKGVGRLDVLTAVNERAIAYYGDQDLSRLPPESLERRARILHAMGQDDETRGDLDSALAKFREARRTTAALLEADPDNPDRLFAQAQSEYGVALIDFRAGRRDAAKAGFTTYRDIARRLTKMKPGEGRYHRELGYAEGNLCTVAIETPPDVEGALSSCAAALDSMKTASRILGDAVAPDLVNRYAWMADAWRAAGRFDKALENRLEQERLLERLVAADPKNMDIKETWVGLQRAMAGLEFRTGRQDLAVARLTRASEAADDLIRLDPANSRWRQLKDAVDANLTYVKTNTPDGATHGAPR